MMIDLYIIIEDLIEANKYLIAVMTQSRDINIDNLNSAVDKLVKIENDIKHNKLQYRKY